MNTMKKMRVCFTTLMMGICYFISTAQIIHFPDPNFKNALVNTKCVDTNNDGFGDTDADLNDDGEIDVSEALNVINLYIYGRQISNLDGIENFKNLIILWCYSNPLTSLNIKGLTNLRGLRCSNNQLTSLDVKGLTNLTELLCHHNQFTSLDVQGLTDLISLRCFNNQLSSLNVQGLTKLKELWCQDNQLTSLNIKGLKSLGPSLFFQNNLNLTYICCDENKINFVKNKSISYGLNCEINSYCTFTPGGKFYIIDGNTYYDYNNSGCDEQDTKLKNFKYNITNGITLGSLISNSTGYYSIPVQEGTHTITPILEHPDHFDITPPSFIVTFPSTSDTITQNFCITPKGIFRQTNITVIPLTPPARPGFGASYKIVWENVGNQIESGTLNFTYDESLLDYISATQTPDQIAEGIVKWNFTNLLPFEKREITVTLKVNRPTDTPAVNSGDKLYLVASIFDNIFVLENTVVGSYDPNDKTCLQGDRIHPDMIGKYVDFLIRFENTGDYAAENVVIKDIIDISKFDISTLKITDASHEMYTRIEGNKVEFIFENIQLPFEDEYNDGHVAFMIKTLPTVVLGDSLKNLADIYFDYNFPIRTNETQSTIALPVSTKDWTSDVKIYPNPVRDILYISNEEIWTKAEFYDISGRIVRSLTMDGSSVDVSGLESGTYIMRMRNGDKVGRVKFVKI